ncbi:unknown [Lactobacillus phage Lb338-1]|uniref:Uncharacterized protein n=1 Tax=Lactobacillus phage Lb338-1 TaxID=2892342 RepID=C1KFU4_9CAUD|nr:hypothetical protein lb338_phage_184 [Lactobacillus phage Lb338-1]ACO37105.1 unknown [Lactobacillus phage Lb338-1]
MAYLGDAYPQGTCVDNSNNNHPHYLIMLPDDFLGTSVDLYSSHVPIEDKLNYFISEETLAPIPLAGYFKVRLSKMLEIAYHLWLSAMEEHAEKAILESLQMLDMALKGQKNNWDRAGRFERTVIRPFLSDLKHINDCYFGGNQLYGDPIPASLRKSHFQHEEPKRKPITLDALLPIAINMVNDSSIMKYPDLCDTTKSYITDCIKGISDGIEEYHEHIKKLDRANAVEKLSSYQKNAFDSIKTIDILPKHKHDKPLG